MKKVSLWCIDGPNGSRTIYENIQLGSYNGCKLHNIDVCISNILPHQIVKKLHKNVP